MFQGVRRRYALQLFRGFRIERTAARRDKEPPERRIAPEIQRLPESGMFAVYRADFRAVFLRFAHEILAAAHQRFFVGESDGHAEPSRRKGIG